MTCRRYKRRLKSSLVHCGNSCSSSSALGFYGSWPPCCYVTATLRLYSSVWSPTIMSTLEYVPGAVTTLAAGNNCTESLLDTFCTSWWFLLEDNYHNRMELAEKNSFVSVWLWNMQKKHWIKMVRFQVLRDCILLLIENKVKFTSATLSDYCIKTYLIVHYTYTYILYGNDKRSHLHLILIQFGYFMQEWIWQNCAFRLCSCFVLWDSNWSCSWLGLDYNTDVNHTMSH